MEHEYAYTFSRCWKKCQIKWNEKERLSSVISQETLQRTFTHTHTYTNGFPASLLGCAVELEAPSRPAAAAHTACRSLTLLCWRKWWKAVSSDRVGAGWVRTESALIGFLSWTLVTRVTMIQQEWLHADARSASSLHRGATWGRRFYHRKPNEATWVFGEIWVLQMFHARHGTARDYTNFSLCRCSL